MITLLTVCLGTRLFRTVLDREGKLSKFLFPRNGNPHTGSCLIVLGLKNGKFLPSRFLHVGFDCTVAPRYNENPVITNI